MSYRIYIIYTYSLPSLTSTTLIVVEERQCTIVNLSYFLFCYITILDSSTLIVIKVEYCDFLYSVPYFFIIERLQLSRP